MAEACGISYDVLAWTAKWLDEILGNATDLPISEHATDTHGVTLVNFALFDLLGLQLSPRIRDRDQITLYRTGSKADFAGRRDAGLATAN
jgi:TnpA family transposase